MDDQSLLNRYVESGCQESFEAIVTRHSGWVYSLSLRAVRDRHLAEDVTQAVFLILARKAAAIRQGTPLSGWLFKTSRFAVSDALKRRARMKNRENRFAEFFKATNGENGATAAPPDLLSDEMSQTLDEAVACLSEADRQAVLLRFYEGKSLAEVGAILGVSEEAAKKRVSRSVDRLRKYFSGRGVAVTLTLLLLLLSQRSAEAQLLPAAAAAAGASLARTIADGALRLMSRAQQRLLGAIFAGALAVLIALPTLGGAVVQLVRDITSSDASPQQKTTRQPTIAAAKTESKEWELPQQSRFADLWIGYKGELIWRSDAYTDRNPVPFYLKAAITQEKPYAVAVDAAGNYFIRPLENSILHSPVIRQGQNDYDAGPTEPAHRVNQMMTLIDPPPAGFNIMPPTHSEKISEKDWHKLRRTEEEDGTVIVEQLMPMRNMQLNNFANDGLNFSVEVPEPATGLLLLGATAILTLRRRRRHH